MARVLFVLNDGPYGSEQSYSALRLAGALSKREGEVVRVFLMGDAVGCARSGQSVPSGFYNIELMVRRVRRHGSTVGVCGTCMDARGLEEARLADGAHRGTLEGLTDWTQWADKVLVF